MNGKKENIVRAVLIACFVIVMLVLFGKPLLSGKPLLAPDTSLASLPFYHHEGWRMLEGTWCPTGLGYPQPPGNVSSYYAGFVFFTPEKYALYDYMANGVLLYIAAMVLLLALGISTRVALIGALAMALSGHSFTLISAGHMGKSSMMPSAVFALAFLRLAITRGNPIWYAIAGLAVATGLGDAQDVMFIFCFLIAAYGIFLFVTEWARNRSFVFARRTIVGGCVALVFFAATAWATLTYAVRVLAPIRETTASASSDLRAESREKWEFDTDWSLPPEEISEFLVPAIFGYETGSQSAPYWGRTGQSLGWDETHQGLRNLRQHGLYLGVTQLVLAIMVLVCAFRGSISGIRRREILFWGGAWIVTVLLALGRYGPLYWLFFKFVPYASNIRCPIKFMHLVEVSTVVLFAFGLDHMLSGSAVTKNSKTASKPAVPCWLAAARICFVIAAVLLIGLVLVTAQKSQLLVRISGMGFAESSSSLFMHLFGAIIRSIVVVGILGWMFWIMGRVKDRSLVSTVLAVGVALLVAIDMTTADLPYVKTEDTRFWYERNVLVDRLAAESQPCRVVCPAGDPLSMRLKATMFEYFGMQSLDRPNGPSADSREKEFLASVPKNPLRYWQLGNAGYVFGPRDALAPLARHPAFENVLGLGLAQDANGTPRFEERPADQAQWVLYRNNSALPRALVYHDWEAVDEKTVFDRLSATNWDPSESVLVEGVKQSHSGGKEPTIVMVTKYEPRTIEIAANLGSEGLLLLNDKYDSDWEVRVDGAKSELLRCNGIMRGVMVPAGKSSVVFVYRSPYATAVKIRLMCLSIVLVWGVVSLLLYMRGKRANVTK